MKDKTKEELDAIQEWYCEDCIARIKKEEDEEKNPDIADVEMDEENKVEEDKNDEEMKEVEQEIAKEKNNGEDDKMEEDEGSSSDELSSNDLKCFLS